MQDFTNQSFKIKNVVFIILIIWILSLFLTDLVIEMPILADVANASLGIILTVFMLYYSKKLHIQYNKQPLKHVTGKKWAKYITLTVFSKIVGAILFLEAILILLLLLWSNIEQLFPLLESISMAEVAETSSLSYVLIFLSICVLAPIWEELFFRGIILRRFLIKRKASTSIFLSSAIFGLFHIGGASILNAFVFGVLLSIIYIRTENILVCIILHSVANFISFLLMLPTGGSVDTAMPFDPNSFVYDELLILLQTMSVVSVILIAISIWLWVKNYRKFAYEGRYATRLVPIEEIQIIEEHHE